MENQLPCSTDGGKPARRVALIADMPDWAFHKIARLVTPQLRPEYDCQTFFHLDYDKENNTRAKKDWRQLFEDLRAGRFDLVHFFWRDAIPQFLQSLTYDSDAGAGSSVEDWLEIGRAHV